MTDPKTVRENPDLKESSLSVAIPGLNFYLTSNFLDQLLRHLTITTMTVSYWKSRVKLIETGADLYFQDYTSIYYMVSKIRQYQFDGVRGS